MSLPALDVQDRGIDPTGTAKLRQRFRKAGELQLRQLRAQLRRCILDHDLLGLTGANVGVMASAPEVKLAAFSHWLTSAANKYLHSDWARPYVEQAWQAGTMAAAREVRAPLHPHSGQLLLQLLHQELNGIVAAIVQQVGRAAARNFASAHKAYQHLGQCFDQVASNRIIALCNTLVVTAYNRAKIAVYRQARVTRVGVIPERLPWSTHAHDAGPPDEERDPQGRWTSGGGSGGLPPEPGTAAIPEGHVRLYHQTTEDRLELIRQHGITLESAKGIEGPRAIYAGETGFYGAPDQVPTVEFHVPKERWNAPFVRADSVLDQGRVAPENIVAIHYPWHARARYIEGNEAVLKNVLAGKHDDLTSDPDYARPIAYIKNKYGPAPRTHDAGPPDEERDPQGRWTAAATSDPAVRDIKTSLPVASVGEQRVVYDLANKQADARGELGRPANSYPIESVAIDRMLATQPGLNSSIVLKYRTEGFSSAPETVEYGGYFYVTQGHHRVEAAKLNGSVHVDAHVHHVAGGRKLRDAKPDEPIREPGKQYRRRLREHMRTEQGEVFEVGVKTAEDDFVCQLCQDYADGAPYDIDDAEDDIPLHPNCRCTMYPWPEGQ